MPGMAHGYAQTPAGTRDVAAMPQVGNPSGGAYSTVADLLRFSQALLGHRLLGPAMTDAVLTGRVAVSRPGGPTVDEYGYGFAVQAVHGVRFVGHNGGTAGYEGQLDVYPTRGYVVVVLTNQDGVLVPAIQESERIATG